MAQKLVPYLVVKGYLFIGAVEVKPENELPLLALCRHEGALEGATVRGEYILFEIDPRVPFSLSGRGLGYFLIFNRDLPQLIGDIKDIRDFDRDLVLAKDAEIIKDRNPEIIAALRVVQDFLGAKDSLL